MAILDPKKPYQTMTATNTGVVGPAKPYTTQATPTTQTLPATTPPATSPPATTGGAFELMKQSQLDAIRKQRETALQGLNSLQTGVKQQAYDQRNSSDVTAMQNAQRMRQTMADLGVFHSGDNITAQAQVNAQRQGALGAINQQESNALTDVGEQRALINNNAASDETAVIQRLQAEQMLRDIEQQKWQQQFDYGKSRDQIGDARWQQQWDYSQGRDTVGDQWRQKEWDYNQGRDTANDQWRQKEWDYSQGRDTIGDQRYNQQFDWQKQQAALEEQFRREQLNWGKIIDTSNQTGYFNGQSNWWNQPQQAPQPSYSQPAPSQPSYSQPAPSQPSYSQPVPSQPAYTPPKPSQPAYTPPKPSTPSKPTSSSSDPNTYYKNTLAEAQRTGNKGLETWAKAQMKK